jgi:hypothetical protein
LLSNGYLFTIFCAVVSWVTIAMMMLGFQFNDLAGLVWKLSGGRGRRAARDAAIMEELVRLKNLSTEGVSLDKAA